jgi:outer membrane protein assembly factor BamA
LEGKFWPDRYYGIGNTAIPEIYEAYEARSVEGKIDVGYRAWSKLYVGPMLEAKYVELAKPSQGGLLEQGAIDGSRPHTVVGLGGSASWDSRDNNMNPSKGIFSELSVLHYPRIGAGGFEFTKASLDVRAYWEFFPTHILAGRMLSQFGFGDLPFTMMPMIGGDQRMRGIMENWVRDRNATSLVGEYRWNFWWRLGMTAFVASVRHSVTSKTMTSCKPTWPVVWGCGSRWCRRRRSTCVSTRPTATLSSFRPTSLLEKHSSFY